MKAPRLAPYLPRWKSKPRRPARQVRRRNFMVPRPARYLEIPNLQVRRANFKRPHATPHGRRARFGLHSGARGLRFGLPALPFPARRLKSRALPGRARRYAARWGPGRRATGDSGGSRPGSGARSARPGRGSVFSGSRPQSAGWCQQSSWPLASRCSRMPCRSFLASAISCSRDIWSRSASIGSLLLGRSRVQSASQEAGGRARRQDGGLLRRRYFLAAAAGFSKGTLTS